MRRGNRGAAFRGGTTESTARSRGALEFARRAQLLAPENAESALNLAGLLIQNGERQEARGLAVALAGTGKPVLGAAASIIFVRLDASEAQFAAALRRARQGVREMKGSGFLVARVELALVALRIARVLGRAPEVAEEGNRAALRDDGARRARYRRRVRARVGGGCRRGAASGHAHVLAPG